ncbi:protein translocase subunit SecDF, partial [Endobacter medicaginis]|nr:protein translocase subunit SecDF [Endobacter medicaginis]
MMSFTPLKKALIWGTCLLGLLLCIPNFVRQPTPSTPWRQIHLGLDLRGGSYLLLQVDLAALERDRLATLTDNVRASLLAAGLGYRNLTADSAAHAVTFTPRSPEESTPDLAAIAKMPRAVPGEFDAAARPDG